MPAKKYDREEMIEMLQRKGEELGRRPTTHDVKQDSDMPNDSTYAHRFGSWESAVEEAGFKRPKTDRSGGAT